MGLEGAGKPEIAQQDAHGDSTEHLESGLLPGLNTDHLHVSARELLFQHDSHGVPVAFQPHNDTTVSELPPISFYDSRIDKPVPQPDVSPWTTKPPEIQPPSQNGETQAENYVVRKGDSLWKIAREHLPQDASNRIVANYVHQIEANNPMRDPNLIMPGQIIKLRGYVPPAEHDTAHGAEHNEAHYHGNNHHERRIDHGGKTYQYPSPQVNDVRHNNNGGDRHQPLPDANHKTTPLHDGTKDTPLPPPQPHNDAQPPVPQHDKPQDTHPVAEELHRVITLAQDKVHDVKALSDIEISARQLAETEGEKARLYMIKDKLSYSTARDNARAEIVETYKQAQRLIEADKSVKLSRDQLHIVAAEILHHAAQPDHTDQGMHNTCQTTALESMMFKLQPSKAAELVADVALTGKFTSPYDGTSVEIDPRPQDREATIYPLENGQRSLASQIFQETAINLAWAKKDPTGKTRYKEVQVSPYSNKTIETLVQEPGSSVHIDSASIHTPYVFAEDVAYMRTAITGKPEEAIVVERGFTCDPETVCVSSAEDLGHKLEQRKETGKLPIIVYVNTSIDSPFKTPEGGYHAILVTDITSDKIRYYNWWGKTSTDREISLNALYGSMQRQSQIKVRTRS